MRDTSGRSGWQATKMRRSRSSSSGSLSMSGAPAVCVPFSSSARPSCAYLSANVRSRRKRSIALRLPTAVSQAPGLAGTPSRGHWRNASTSASCASSSARSRSFAIRASVATTRGNSIRKTVSTAVVESATRTAPIQPPR